MAAYKTLAMASMPLLSYTGLAGMAGTASRNGLFDMLRGGKILGEASHGAFAVPARICRSMIRFFMPIVSLEHAGVGLQGARFLTIWTTIWLLMNVESMQGNRGDLSKRFLAIFGLLAEFVGVGTVLPIWCLINLWHTHTQPMQANSTSAIAHQDDVDAMIRSLLVGIGLPTVLMYFSSPSSENLLFSRQVWIVVRLFHPAISALLFYLTRRSPTEAQLSAIEISISQRKLQQLKRIAVWMAALAHILSIIAAAVIAFRRAGSKAQDQWSSILPAVVLPWQAWTEKIESLAEGVGIFLFWDEAMTSAAILFWAMTINGLEAKGETLFSIGQALVLAVAAGPVAAAATLV